MDVYYGVALNILEADNGTGDCNVEFWRIEPDNGTSVSLKEHHVLPSALGMADSREWLKEMLISLIEKL